MTSHYMNDYRKELASEQPAMLRSVVVSDSVKQAVFDLNPKTDAETQVELSIGDMLPIGDNECSNWTIQDILVDKVFFRNGCVMRVGDDLNVGDAPKAKPKPKDEPEPEPAPESESEE